MSCMERGIIVKENKYLNLLKNKNFVAFWSATTLLRLASNILQFSLAVYVLDLTGSAFVYSTVLSVIILPRILCTSVAGYLADYKDNIRILRLGTMVAAGVMALFGMIHVLVIPLNVPLIYMLVICLELCETFLAPTEGKALLYIVAQDEIASASKLSSLDDGFVEILSPVIAALCYNMMGLTSVLCITVMIETIALLLIISIQQRDNRAVKTDHAMKSVSCNIRTVYREAYCGIKKYPYVVGIILFAPLFNFFVAPQFSVVAPYFFRLTMNANIDAYAMFNAVLGFAGLLAPFFAMFFVDDRDEYKANKAGTLVAASVLICLVVALRFGSGFISQNGMLYAVTGAMALLVLIITIMNIATSITIKKHIPEQILGRVLSIIQLCATISVPLGQLFYGVCMDSFPVVVSLIISALGLVITFIVMVKTYQRIQN